MTGTSITPPRAAATALRESADRRTAGKPAELTSTQLFGGAQALVIHHEGERYTLRRTSKGKLILTK